MPQYNYARQQRRRWWAQLRVDAIELREARQRWADRDTSAHERVLHFLRLDLERDEQQWTDAWHELDDYRRETDQHQRADPNV